MGISEQITDFVTFKNAKLISCFIVLCSILFNAYKHEKEYHCYKDLLNHNHFENTARFVPSNSSCVMKRYINKEVRECMSKGKNEGNKNFLFVGTSPVKNLWNSFTSEISGNSSLLESTDYRDNTLRVSSRYMPIETPDLSLRKLFEKMQNGENEVPDFVVLGFFSDKRDVKKQDNDLEAFLSNMTSITFALDLLGQRTHVLWYFKSSLPYKHSSSGQDNKEISRSQPNMIDVKNKKIKKMLKGMHVQMWEATPRQNESSYLEQYRIDAQVLLNLICNNKRQKYETQTLCCGSKPSSLSTAFVVLLIITSLAIISIGFLYHHWNNVTECIRHKYLQTDPKLRNKFPFTSIKLKEPILPLQEPHPEKNQNEKNQKRISKTFNLIIKSALIFGFFYLCDRTNLFQKGRKHFTWYEFSLSVTLCAVAGLVLRGKSPNSDPLNREITDEWKGWMQLIILIYHFTGASSVLPIYIHIRILVSAYLFMTGFGNFCYYWDGGDLSFRRYCQVILRMNLLTIVLCVVMDQSYQFYYFVPLVSFWYTILFLVLILPPKLNKNAEGVTKPSRKDYIAISFKLALLTGIVIVMSYLKNIFDAVFLLPFWKFLFVLPFHGDYEWWFRWQLDKFSIIYGAIFGLLFKGFSYNVIGEAKLKSGNSNFRLLATGVAGCVMMASYSLILRICSTKQQCNYIHPYVVWVPILGFILLRNISDGVRAFHSRIMTAAGKISLELFICQYHIWLAADTRGLLILIPAVPAINYIFTTLVFVCVASEVHEITAEFTRLIVQKDNTRTLLNLLILVLVVLLGKLII